MRAYLALLFSLAGQNRRLRAEVDRLTNELVVQQARVRRWRAFVESFAPHLPDKAQTAIYFQGDSDDIADIDEYHRPEPETT
ncbi:MAG: hypothetical protein ACOYXR_08365 [Nitrospirota bacterium]